MNEYSVHNIIMDYLFCFEFTVPSVYNENSLSSCYYPMAPENIEFKFNTYNNRIILVVEIFSMKLLSSRRSGKPQMSRNNDWMSEWENELISSILQPHCITEASNASFRTC